MVSVHEVAEYLWSIAPTPEPWDNVGHLVGRERAAVKKILVALDITMPVIRAPRSRFCSMLSPVCMFVYSGWVARMTL